MAADLKSLADMLRNARLRKGYPLREVEGHVKVSNAYISQLEGAKIKRPSPLVLYKLCRFFAVDYNAAWEFAGYPLPKKHRLSACARFAARLGRITPDEEDALVEYLQFVRTKKDKKPRGRITKSHKRETFRER